MPNEKTMTLADAEKAYRAACAAADKALIPYRAALDSECSAYAYFEAYEAFNNAIVAQAKAYAALVRARAEKGTK
jgi:hypothetical protein